ncbi:MAG: hypothetical protein IKM99_10200 [Bacteroidales bacterium]|nr:hypothetical protein [Bacteroidales bacterium]
MKANSILYYPHIEFQNEAWVKSSLLLWDHVYRIVPEDYTPIDSDEIKALVDADLVRSIKLDDKDREETFDEFLRLCDKLDNRLPAGLIPSEEERIHPDKIDNRLYPYLDLIGEHFIDDFRWLHLSKELARGYMFKLSQVVARIRNLNRGTDDLDAWSITPFFCENANFGEFLQDPDANGFFCSVTLEDVVPENIGGVSSHDLISFVNNRKDERKLLREKFNDFTSHLAMISNLNHAGQIEMDFVNELMESKEEYRKSMDKWKDIPALAISTGVPVSLTTLGTLSSIQGNPFSLLRIAGSLVMGAICSYADFYRAKKRRDPSYSSYLIGVDKLCKNVRGESYTRLEEFIND